MPAAPLRCRQCGASSLRNLGAIPASNLFAGQTLEPPWPGGHLLVCSGCHLGQRQPLRPPDEYERLYAAASGWVWTRADLRGDQRRVRDRIEREAEGRDVLDIGCYDGTLLASLSSRWRRHGIEPSADAAEIARGREVSVLGSSLEAFDRADGAPVVDMPLPDGARRFDVICAVDVVEHVPDPAGFMARMVRRLAPGGLLIVSTGDLGAPAWRAAGGAYWYCSFPEHMSFLSEAWLRQWSPRHGLRIEGLERFAYDGASGISHQWRFWRRVLRTRIQAGLRAILPSGQGRSKVRVLGEPGPFEDHLLVAMRCLRPGQQETPPARGRAPDAADRRG